MSSDAFLQKLFEPGELDSVYKTGAIARSVRLNTNPSGTAVVQGAMQDVQKPVRSLGPKWAAAKLTNADWFNDWMMRNPRTGDEGCVWDGTEVKRSHVED